MDISFVLVKPSVPENIGAAARAIKTMGFSSLRLVNAGNHLADEARWLAHASNDVLENAQIYSNLEDALSDIDLSIATSAKKRSVKADYIISKELPSFVRQKGNTIKTVAIIFGSEESGLSNTEIAYCDVISFIPLARPYPSVNLAQSVMIYAYLMSEFSLPINSHQAEVVDEQSFKKLKIKLKESLQKLEFKPESNIYKRIFERISFLEEDDIHLLHSVLNRFLKEN